MQKFLIKSFSIRKSKKQQNSTLKQFNQLSDSFVRSEYSRSFESGDGLYNSRLVYNSQERKSRSLDGYNRKKQLKLDSIEIPSEEQHLIKHKIRRLKLKYKRMSLHILNNQNEEQENQEEYRKRDFNCEIQQPIFSPYQQHDKSNKIDTQIASSSFLNNAKKFKIKINMIIKNSQLTKLKEQNNENHTHKNLFLKMVLKKDQSCVESSMIAIPTKDNDKDQNDLYQSSIEFNQTFHYQKYSKLKFKDKMINIELQIISKNNTNLSGDMIQNLQSKKAINLSSLIDQNANNFQLNFVLQQNQNISLNFDLEAIELERFKSTNDMQQSLNQYQSNQQFYSQNTDIPPSGRHYSFQTTRVDDSEFNKQSEYQLNEIFKEFENKRNNSDNVIYSHELLSKCPENQIQSNNDTEVQVPKVSELKDENDQLRAYVKKLEENVNQLKSENENLNVQLEQKNKNQIANNAELSILAEFDYYSYTL